MACALNCSVFRNRWHERFSRRVFLRGTLTGLVFILLSPIPAPAECSAVRNAALRGESWVDRSFWDDRTGWI